MYQSTSPITISFSNEDNKAHYLEAVLEGLKADFDRLEEPSRHFWHNREIIKEGFSRGKALVAMNDEQEVVGYLLWNSFTPVSAEIDIVEVKESYRRQGIMRKMLDSITEKFKDICVLTASPIPESEHVFDNFGFERMERNKVRKIVREVLPTTQVLPNGKVIAVSSDNFYAIQRNPEKAKDKMKYFQIEMDKEAKLLTPIITDFHYEGYVGVYLDKKLITQGKAKHLFEQGEDCSTESNLFILRKLTPIKPELFEGFLPGLDSEPELNEELLTGSTLGARQELRESKDNFICPKPLIFSNLNTFEPVVEFGFPIDYENFEEFDNDPGFGMSFDNFLGIEENIDKREREYAVSNVESSDNAGVSKRTKL